MYTYTQRSVIRAKFQVSASNWGPCSLFVGVVVSSLRPFVVDGIEFADEDSGQESMSRGVAWTVDDKGPNRRYPP